MNLKECIYKDTKWITTATGQICGLYQGGKAIIALPRYIFADTRLKEIIGGCGLFRGGCEIYAVCFEPYMPDSGMKSFLSRLLAATESEIDSLDNFPIMSLN